MKTIFGPSHRLFWRVYWHGLLLLVVVAVALPVTAWLTEERAGWVRARQRLHEYLLRDAASLQNDPEALLARFNGLYEAFGLEATVYRNDGSLVLSSGEQPLPAGEKPPSSVEWLGRFRWSGWRAPLPNTDMYVVARHSREGSIFHIFSMLGVLLGILALLSLPFARAIARPLERLTRTAMRLGEGDLKARSGINRNDEVGVLAAALDDMAGKLEGLLQTQRELVANVSHELRTPMARIRVALELAEETSDVAVVRKRLEGISEDLADLERLVDDTLALTRIDLALAQSIPGGFRLRRSTIQVDEWLRDITARFEAIHPAHPIDLVVAETVSTLSADAALVRRALDNVLANAARYSAPDAGPILLTAAKREQGLEIEIRDRGPGVDPQILNCLFEPFFRTEESRAKTDGGGVGLGLTLARRITEAHGGRIEAFAPPGGGLGVRILLPEREV